MIEIWKYTSIFFRVNLPKYYINERFSVVCSRVVHLVEVKIELSGRFPWTSYNLVTLQMTTFQISDHETQITAIPSCETFTSNRETSPPEISFHLKKKHHETVAKFFITNSSDFIAVAKPQDDTQNERLKQRWVSFISMSLLLIAVRIIWRRRIFHFPQWSLHEWTDWFKKDNVEPFISLV